ncbi:MAG TPA: PhaM family polyhydroxyalkanoate granule multifunctional regulatory protein, partial [Paucimonas sp.]|nr:PhaM family polyhydroxyalkanoate granule multifunctional regulatory protein [Paucimonas sp.]
MMQSNTPNMPGVGAMTDTLEFVKKLWGGLSVPGMVAPTVSTDELDKQISDLKTVETWLTMNMNMLRGSIQALEVQRATIATLKSMGDAFSAATQTG